MTNGKKFLLVGGLIAVIIFSWAYGLNSWLFSEDNPGEDDVAVKAASQWLKLVAAGSSDQLAALTRKAGFEKFITRYKADTESLGTASDRYFCRKSSYNSKHGRLVVAEYEVWFNDRKRPITEKVFMIESKGKDKTEYLVIDARYIVTLPRLHANGVNYTAETDSSAGDPVALAQKWFNLFDYGKLEQCSYITYPKTCFNKGRYFFDLKKATMDYKLYEELKKMYVEGCPGKRTTISKQLWNGIPGGSEIKVFCLTSRATYEKFSRIERIWAYKDCYHSNPQWLLYAVDFTKEKPPKKPVKKKAKSQKKTGKNNR